MTPKSIENNWEISFCGLNCAKCDIFLASHGEDELREELLSWFKENIDPKIEYIGCEKCRGPNQDCWTPDCELRSCAIRRNKKYCFECPEFVCDKLKKFANEEIGHHKRTIENLKEMKKIGLKKWISLQKEPKFCP
ncbi:MAG: DUF3795 domain-containing protein [Candidatus Hermodarchaeota archaeon]